MTIAHDVSFPTVHQADSAPHQPGAGLEAGEQLLKIRAIDVFRDERASPPSSPVQQHEHLKVALGFFLVAASGLVRLVHAKGLVASRKREPPHAC